VNSKGSNKDKRQRPEGLVIQEVDPDMTNPAFVMRMAEADEHLLLEPAKKAPKNRADILSVRIILRIFAA
jgi:hypothetical protein